MEGWKGIGSRGGGKGVEGEMWRMDGWRPRARFGVGRELERGSKGGG